MLILIVFTCLALFAPPEFVDKNNKWMALIGFMGTGIFGLMTINSDLEKNYLDSFTNPWLIRSLYTVLFFVVLYFGWIIIDDIFDYLWRILIYEKIFFFYIVLFIPIVIFMRLAKRSEQLSILEQISLANDASAENIGSLVSVKYCFWLVGLGINSVFIYISVLVFSLLVYPHIPSQKGGGGYADASKVRIYFKKNRFESIDKNLFDGAGGRSRPVIVLYKGNNSIYVAQETTEAPVDGWGKVGENAPFVYEIPTRSIINVTYTNDKNRPRKIGGSLADKAN